MKNKIIVIASMLFLLTLVSCGSGGTSQAKLEISNGFLASNAGFDGGLIITGKNTTTGASFSVNLSSGVQSQMELPKGSWTFLAVGWDGGVLPYKMFGGIPSCGRTDVILSADSQIVELNVTPARCGTDESFSSNEFKESTAPFHFKKLQRIFSCNTFISHLSPILSSDLISTKLYTKANPGVPLFCTTVNNMPVDLQTNVKSYKIRALDKSVGQTVGSPGLSTPCLAGDSYEPSSLDYIGIDMRLPSKIPLVIETFEDSSCTKKLALMPFESGLEGNYSASFDSVFHTDALGNILLLPGNDIRRAKSPFTHLLPSFKCTGGIGCPVEPGVATAKYYGYVGSGNRIYDRTTKVCPAAITVVGGTISSFSCNVKKDGIDITYTYSGATGIKTFTVGSSTYDVYIKSTSSIFEAQKNFIHPRLFQLLGNQTSTFPRTFFNEFQGDDGGGREYFGTLGRIREMLNAPAALIGISDPADQFGQACANASGTKEISLYDNESLSFNTYRVEISNPIGSVAPNEYICQALLPGVTSGTCPNNFEKEMNIFDYEISSITPSIKIKINCNEKFGKFSSYDQNDESNSRRIEKNFIAWNTDAVNSQRFESATISSEYFLDPATKSTSLISEKRILTRIEKQGLNSYAWWDLGFSTHLKISGLWDQNMYSGQFITDNTNPNLISYDFYGVADDTTSQYNYLLTTTVNTPVMSARLATPLTTGSSTSKFDLTTSWGSQVDAGPGMVRVGVNANNPKFNGSLFFKLDSLINLETGM